jgi:hypothetical protein
MTTPPTLQQVRDYLAISATALSDEVLQTMLDACLGDQAARCTWVVDAYPAALTQGLYRRVQREVAAKNLPLGMVGMDAEYGPQAIPMYDALIETHERSHRVQVVG